MGYRLRTLIVLLILGPPILAAWVDRDPFQIFLVTGFIAYSVFCIVVGSVLGRLVHGLTKLL
jgi:hypothetical protein